jgi:starch synthase
MRYGSIPIVRETGGLKDTVLPYNKYTSEGTGFSFYEKSSYVLKDVIFEAIDLFENNKEEWNKLTERNLEQDFSLDKTAKEYIKLYKQIIGG